jgi:hypothetical protein
LTSLIALDIAAIGVYPICIYEVLDADKDSPL